MNPLWNVWTGVHYVNRPRGKHVGGWMDSKYLDATVSLLFYSKQKVFSQVKLYVYEFKRILCDFCIFTLEQIIVLNTLLYLYQTYSQNITCQNTTEFVSNEIQKYNKKVRNKVLNVDCEAIRAWITLKLGSLLSFMIGNAFL